MSAGEQLTLALAPPSRDPQDTFAEGPSNSAARATLAQWRHWPSGAMTLVGPARSGKSHLAAVWAMHYGAVVFPPKVWGRQPDHVMSLGPEGLAVLEDADSAQAGVGEALYTILNATRRSELTCVLITARTRPSGWSAPGDVVSPDVLSRLTHLPFVEMHNPDDAELRAILIKLFEDRGVNVSDAVIEYVVRRIERSHAAAFDLVDTLDRRALAQNAKITRTLAAKVLEDLLT